MRVADLARRTGITPSAIRFYEAVGALPPAPRRDNGYREYADADITRLRVVITLRRLGLSPQDAGRLAGLCLAGGTLDLGLAPLVAAQRAEIRRQREDLDRLDAELTDLEHTVDAAGRARAALEGSPVPDNPIRVLFVCTGNSARSQIAEAMLGQLGGSDFEVHSAGVEPHGVNPFTVRVLGETGIDWTRARSKSVDEFLAQPFDYVITVCDRARQSCPVFPGDYNRLHWGLDDPAGVEGSDELKLAAFRRTQIELSLRLRPFIELARGARRSPVPAAS